MLFPQKENNQVAPKDETHVDRKDKTLVDSKDKTQVEILADSLIESLDSSIKNQYSEIKEKYKEYDASIINEKLQEVDNNSEATLLYLAEMCKDIYNTEVERESSILQQASNMQSAFSFVTAGLFVIAQIVSDHRGGRLTPFWVLIGFGIITLLLMLSLVSATIAQRRYPKNGPPTIELLLEEINKNNSVVNMQYARTRHKFTIKQFGAYHYSLKKVNDKRIFWIKVSMFLFYLALGSSLLVTIILSCKDGL